MRTVECLRIRCRGIGLRIKGAGLMNGFDFGDGGVEEGLDAQAFE